MKGVAMADLHLGFVGAGKDIEGRNGREIDVERAWRLAVQSAIDAQPDLITIAGDCFHHPRPSMHAVIAWRDGIRRLVRETNAYVVVAIGNHDAVRSTTGKSPVHVPDDYERVEVVTEPTRVQLRAHSTGEDVSVAVFPFVSMGDGQAYRVEPDAEAAVNVLVVHAAVRGDAEGDAMPRFYGGDGGALDIGSEAERWDVIACGDFHDFRRLHPTRMAFYSGSIERTSSNIWPEAGPKGIVVYDTDAAVDGLRFVEHATRHMVDLDFSRIHGGEPSAQAVNQVLADQLGMWDDSIVRLRIDGFPRAEKDEIDWSMVRHLKDRCFHFHFDLRFSAAEGIGSDHRDGAASVEEAARQWFAGDPEPVRAIAFECLGIDASPGEIAEAFEAALTSSIALQIGGAP